MRLEVLTDDALRQLEPAELMELIAAEQRLIDTAAAETRQPARATGDATVADSMVRTTGQARRAARGAGPRHARPAAHVTPCLYDDLMNTEKCPEGLASPGRNRCHTPSLGLSHAT